MAMPHKGSMTLPDEGTANYLSFRLAEEVFALDILRVREVLDVEPVTRMPRMPAFLLGVINLRGSVLPVVDLRLRFGLPPAERTVDSCIIIVEALAGGDLTVLGLLADAVEEVLELPEGSIAAVPKFGTRVDTSFLSGVGRLHDRMLMVLDIDHVFSEAELEAAARAA